MGWIYLLVFGGAIAILTFLFGKVILYIVGFTIASITLLFLIAVCLLRKTLNYCAKDEGPEVPL